MNLRTKFLCGGLLMLLFLVGANSNFVVQGATIGTTYYVDSISGDDSNGGDSESQAWKTLEKVNATIFQPGDRILFKANGIWEGQLFPKGSGNEQDPITIDMYGIGNKPIINGNGISGELGASVLLYNQEYWEINNLEITNNAATEEQRYGVLVRFDNYGTGNHIYINNLNIHDIKGIVGDRFVGDGILIVGTGNQVPTNYNDVKIENCTVEDVTRTGISVWNQWAQRESLSYAGRPGYHATTGDYYASTNVVVRNNTINNVMGDGILVSVCDGAIIEYNVASHCNLMSGQANVAMWPHNSDNTIMQYNEAYLTHHTLDGQGFDVDILCHNTIVQYNYSHDNEGGFLLICSDPRYGSTTNTVVRYNISENDRCRSFEIKGKVYNSFIYNNTIYAARNISVDVYNMGTIFLAYANGTYSYNNIYYMLGGASYKWFFSQNNFFTNNCYYGTHPSSEPYDSMKITKNPRLIAPGMGSIGRNTVNGYQLESNSPLIDRGIPMENHGGKDYFGNTVPYDGGKMDIGAHEYQGVKEVKQNIAFKKDVYVSSTVENYDWSKDASVDGIVDSIENSNGWTSTTGIMSNHTECIMIDLGRIYDVEQVNLYPRNDLIGEGFPIDFNIKVSEDTVNWTTVVTENNYPTPLGGAEEFDFSITNARYIMIEGTNLRQVGTDGYMMQLAEIEVFAASDNLAYDKPITVSSSLEGWGWSKPFIVDGNMNDGWSSAIGNYTNEIEWVELDLESVYSIGKVMLYPRTDLQGEGFPIDFNIKVSEDGINWITVINEMNYPLPVGNVETFTFNNTNARYIKIEGTNLRVVGSDGYLMQLEEVEVY